MPDGQYLSPSYLPKYLGKTYMFLGIVWETFSSVEMEQPTVDIFKLVFQLADPIHRFQRKITDLLHSRRLTLTLAQLYCVFFWIEKTILLLTFLNKFRAAGTVNTFNPDCFDWS